jgi:acylphosphatase
MSGPVARRLSIRGRVQGVGFRDAMLDAAHALGIVGWVRNRLDGTVEALVQGTPDSVERMIAFAKRGPPAARVSAVDVSEAGFDPSCSTFERTRTS